METILNAVLSKEKGEPLKSFQKIVGLGQVNEVYDVSSTLSNYIIRLNSDIDPAEYPKEVWCIAAATDLGIPSPRVYGQGRVGEYAYMLQEKLPGLNGKQALPAEKTLIWRKLGEYARLFNQVEGIELDAVKEAEFHQNWQARLDYNLKMLNQEDSLLTEGWFSAREHSAARALLASLKDVSLTSGLVHGDLCPRNTLLHHETVYLIDWGAAEVNVVPHTTLGLLLMSEDCSADDFRAFLQGYGMASSEFMAISHEVNLLNFLYRLDKYRWAETYAKDELPTFVKRLREAFVKLISE